jgi:hypothetical protein
MCPIPQYFFVHRDCGPTRRPIEEFRQVPVGLVVRTQDTPLPRGFAHDRGTRSIAE